MALNPFTSAIRWARAQLYWVANGRKIARVYGTAAADAVAKESAARIGKAADDLQAGTIDLNEYRDRMREAVKYGHGANVALARGGFDQMRPADWRRAEKLVDFHWQRLDAHIERIRVGNYGPQLQSRRFNLNALQYADAMRGSYENERLQMHRDDRYDEAKRLLSGGANHCTAGSAPGCIEEAGKGWMPIGEMVPINACECGAQCNCALIFRRKKA